MSLTLVVQDKEGKTSSYALNSELVLGRADTVDVSLLSKNVSRRHAKVRLQGKKILVEDLGSSNGVLVNGAKIGGPTEITAGSEFQIGEFIVKIESQEPEATSDASVGSLTGQNGTFLDKVLPLKSGDNIVGRGSECDVFVADGSISRKHAILHVAGDKITVRDMGSANGTVVDGKKIQDATPLHHGDVVRFGSLSFKIELANAPMRIASAPQPLAKQPSAAQPLPKQPSAPQPVSIKQSAAAPVVTREPSGQAQQAPVKPVTPVAPISAPGAPVDWLKVGALLATPVIAAFFIGVLGSKLFGSSGGDLDALRAQMNTTAVVEQASALKGQNKFTEAEALLLPILEKNPGESNARALFNAVHDEADNQRALDEAKALVEQKNNEGAIEKLSTIEDDSFFYPEAKEHLQKLQKSPLAALLKTAAASCEMGDYQACLESACQYISAVSETDIEIINFARVAYGLKLQSSGPGDACVKDPIQPPQADKSLAMIEKEYGSDPRKDFIVAYLSGKSPQEISTQLQEAAMNGGDKSLSDASAAFASIQSSLDIFSKRLSENDLSAAEKAARAVWESEQKLFKGFDGPAGSEARKKLLEAHAKEFASRELQGFDGLQDGKDFIKRMAGLDAYNNSPLRYAMAARYQAKLREIFDSLAERPDIAKTILDKIIPLMNSKSKLKALAQEKSAQLSPR
jgi:pSer/pThr/pTyr-binding forkhead associated (FHA) protein